MIVQVARAFGQPSMTVARAPFAETAWTFGQLQEVERQAGLVREAEGLRAADLSAAAFHDPKQLERRRRDLLSRLDGTRPQISAAEARVRARRMIARMEREGVLDDVLALAPAPAMES
ncbi:MAG: hypothetical protein WC700_02145 [Gemmatimonadaceae bacterium]|jgi:hypothetical protein